MTLKRDKPFLYWTIRYFVWSVLVCIGSLVLVPFVGYGPIYVMASMPLRIWGWEHLSRGFLGCFPYDGIGVIELAIFWLGLWSLLGIFGAILQVGWDAYRTRAKD